MYFSGVITDMYTEEQFDQSLISAPSPGPQGTLRHPTTVRVPFASGSSITKVPNTNPHPSTANSLCLQRPASKPELHRISRLKSALQQAHFVFQLPACWYPTRRSPHRWSAALGPQPGTLCRRILEQCTYRYSARLIQGQGATAQPQESGQKFNREIDEAQNVVNEQLLGLYYHGGTAPHIYRILPRCHGMLGISHVGTNGNG